MENWKAQRKKKLADQMIERLTDSRFNQDLIFKK